MTYSFLIVTKTICVIPRHLRMNLKTHLDFWRTCPLLTVKIFWTMIIWNPDKKKSRTFISAIFFFQNTNQGIGHILRMTHLIQSSLFFVLSIIGLPQLFYTSLYFGQFFLFLFLFALFRVLPIFSIVLSFLFFSSLFSVSSWIPIQSLSVYGILRLSSCRTNLLPCSFLYLRCCCSQDSTLQ